MGECLEAALAAGKALEGPVQARLAGWFAHHLPVILMTHLLPTKPVIDYGLARDELVEQVVWFILRGMGLKEEAIRAALQPQGPDAAHGVSFASLCVKSHLLKERCRDGEELVGVVRAGGGSLFGVWFWQRSGAPSECWPPWPFQGRLSLAPCGKPASNAPGAGERPWTLTRNVHWSGTAPAPRSLRGCADLKRWWR